MGRGENGRRRWEGEEGDREEKGGRKGDGERGEESKALGHRDQRRGKGRGRDGKGYCCRENIKGMLI